MKVWCARCHGRIRDALQSEYGDYEFTNAELLTYIHSNEIVEVLSPPILKFKVPAKTKKGVSKSKTKIISSFPLITVLFAGKKFKAVERRLKDENDCERKFRP